MQGPTTPCLRLHIIVRASWQAHTFCFMPYALSLGTNAGPHAALLTHTLAWTILHEKEKILYRLMGRLVCVCAKLQDPTLPSLHSRWPGPKRRRQWGADKAAFTIGMPSMLSEAAGGCVIYARNYRSCQGVG
jgi:hypothetical protein